MFSPVARDGRSHLYFDQPRPWFAYGFRKRLVEIIDIGDRAPRHAHAPGERDEVDGRAIDLQHVERALARLACADAVELAAQDLVDPIGEHDGDDVEAFARLRPQGLDRVHRAAVA